MTFANALIVAAAGAVLISCTASRPAASDGARPMDEVPVQARTTSGDRQYSFANGCVIVLEANRAIVRTEAASCQLHHRDIALLYASGD